MKTLYAIIDTYAMNANILRSDGMLDEAYVALADIKYSRWYIPGDGDFGTSNEEIIKIAEERPFNDEVLEYFRNAWERALNDTPDSFLFIEDLEILKGILDANEL